MRPSRRSFTAAFRPARRPRWFLPGARCAAIFPVLLASLAWCGNSALRSEQIVNSSPAGFRMRSAAFTEGEAIPRRFTCEGANISPALHWTEPPDGTRSLALVVEDPDAPGGVWTHWVVYNLPAQARELQENVPRQAKLPGGGAQGRNSFGHTGYEGPCPPPGNAHRYFFRLYALDSRLSLQPGATRQEVQAAAKVHVLGEAQLMGRFKR